MRKHQNGRFYTVNNNKSHQISNLTSLQNYWVFGRYCQKWFNFFIFTKSFFNSNYLIFNKNNAGFFCPSHLSCLSLSPLTSFSLSALFLHWQYGTISRLIEKRITLHVARSYSVVVLFWLD